MRHVITILTLDQVDKWPPFSMLFSPIEALEHHESTKDPSAPVSGILVSNVDLQPFSHVSSSRMSRTQSEHKEGFESDEINSFKRSLPVVFSTRRLLGDERADANRRA